MLMIALLLGAATLLYVWLKWNFSYWKRCKAPGPKPLWIIGNLAPLLTFSKHWGVVIADWYKEYSNEPYVAYYKLMRPAIVPRDPDLIRDIMINQFDSFRRNDFQFSKKHDPLLAPNPFVTEGDEWHEGRKIVSPVFSQAKLKSMMPVMDGVGKRYAQYVGSYSSDTDFEAKDLSRRFTMENVIRCTFSFDAGCFDTEKESEFSIMGKAMFAPALGTSIKFLWAPLLPPRILDMIPIPFIPHEAARLFRKLVEANKASRSDDHYDEEFLAVQAVTIFVDGTETTSTDCQEKVYEEIVSCLAKHGGELTYDVLSEMEYLESCLFEALRIHPTAQFMTKICTKPYTLPKTSGQSEGVTIQPGTPVSLPVIGIHSDPKYYPDPDKFIPDRFSAEEQRNRHKGTYLGFGEGPRICVGMRLGKVQVKVALVHLIRTFRIKISPNHKPISNHPKAILSSPKDGILVRFEPRN